jgi:hypothetical protein
MSMKLWAHGFDAPLYARQLEGAADRLHLAVEIHEAPDRGAVDVADGRHIDQQLPRSTGDERGDRRRELGEQRIHHAGLADPHDGDVLPMIGRKLHSRTPV